MGSTIFITIFGGNLLRPKQNKKKKMKRKGKRKEKYYVQHIGILYENERKLLYSCWLGKSYTHHIHHMTPPNDKT